ncbi:unnamed protein product, partial [Polarella glacialis]
MCVALQERRSGEFSNLRVCRELACAASGGATGSKSRQRGFDVELVRWGTAAPATPEDLAEAMFPPSGRPPDEAAATWQWELFHRIFQKDASRYVTGAAWLILRALMARGVKLQLQGRQVVDLGIAHGLFFRRSAEGPEPAFDGVSALAASRADAFALCMGEDRRVIMVPSFTSLGVMHKWILLRLGEDSGDDSQGAEFAADLCGGALGLLLDGPKAASSSRGLTRVWPACSDSRFVVRSSRWGAAAAALAQPPPATARRGLDQRRAALEAMLAAAGLPFAPEAPGGSPTDADIEAAQNAAFHSEGRACAPAALMSAFVASGAFAQLASDRPQKDPVQYTRGPRGGGLVDRNQIRTKDWSSSWRSSGNGEEDKGKLLADLRSGKLNPKQMGETVAALQQRKLLTTHKEYTLVIKIFGKLGWWKEAMGLLVEMQRKSIMPNVMTYNAVIKAMAKGSQWRPAIELIAEMWAEGCRPDVITYSIAISACDQAGRWMEALQLLAEMERSGIKPDNIVFNSAISACARAGKWDRAMQLLGSMPARGLRPDVISYNAAINACARGGEWAEALKLLGAMRDEGLSPETRTFN